MRRHQLAIALVAGLAGGALVTLGSRRPWQPVDLVAGVGTTPQAQESVAGSLGAVILLGALVVGVTRAVGRRVTGAVVALAAVGVLAAVLTADGAWAGWRGVVLAGAVLGLGSGALAAARGHRWASMGGKYDAPGSRPAHESDPWRALDRGEDPTV